MAYDFLNQIRTKLEDLFGNATGVLGMSPKPPKIISPLPPEPQATPTPAPQAPSPEPTAAPGIGSAMTYIQDQMPPSSTQTPQEYYPALGDQGFMQGITEADKLRQGLGALLLLQAFNESTLGRAGNGNNVFGALPPGGISFNSPRESLDYQLSPNVLGGGANPNMNILSERTPLTPSAVEKLYSSYNPEGVYLQQILATLFGQGR